MTTPRFESPAMQDLIGVSAACFAPERGTVRVTGSDRIRFLNGMLTNDVAALASGQASEALQLDRKGHVLAELSTLAFDGELWLDIAEGAEATLTEMLDKHIIADDVNLESLSTVYDRLSVEGADACARLQAIDAPVPEPGTCVRSEWRGDEVIAYGGGWLTPRGVRFLGSSELLQSLRAALELPLLEAGQAELLRIESFRPALGVDASDRNFPQEARLEDRVSFTKGCYIGQEIVARIASRGAVNRLLVKIAASAPTRAGDPIHADGKPVGEVTSAVSSPVSGELALGYVKKAHAAPESVLQIHGKPARVLGPAG